MTCKDLLLLKIIPYLKLPDSSACTSQHVGLWVEVAKIPGNSCLLNWCEPCWQTVLCWCGVSAQDVLCDAQRCLGQCMVWLQCLSVYLSSLS